MVTPCDIADCLETMLRAVFPGEDVHRELTPSNFERPCNLIVQEECEGDVAMGSNVVELRPTFMLTTFVEADEYHHSHLKDLHARQMKIVGLFLPGYIKVGNRAPKVVGMLLGGGYDFDTVKVTFSYALDRNDFIETPQLPTISQLHLSEEVTTYG